MNTIESPFMLTIAERERIAAAHKRRLLLVGFIYGFAAGSLLTGIVVLGLV